MPNVHFWWFLHALLEVQQALGNLFHLFMFSQSIQDGRVNAVLIVWSWFCQDVFMWRSRSPCSSSMQTVLAVLDVLPFTHGVYIHQGGRSWLIARMSNICRDNACHGQDQSYWHNPRPLVGGLWSCLFGPQIFHPKSKKLLFPRSRQ